MGYINVDRDSFLADWLERALQAYNHRTDVIEAESDVVVQRKIDAAVADLKGSSDSLQQAVDNDKGDT